MIIFCALMNMAGLNTDFIHICNNTNKIERRLFLRELGLTLTEEHLQWLSFAMNVPPLVRKRMLVHPMFNKIKYFFLATRKDALFATFYGQKCEQFLCLSHLQAWCSHSVTNQ